jgi:ADP-heptose:LPS heptosyltransferase
VYEHCPYVNGMIVLEEKRIFSKAFLRAARDIRRRKYDMVLLDVNHKAFYYQLLSLLLGARKLIGFDWGGRGAFCHLSLPFDPALSGIGQNLMLVQLLGGRVGERRNLEYWMTEEDRRSVCDLLAGIGIDENDTLICVHPASHWPSNGWFPDRFAAVIRILVSRHNAKVVVTGLDTDRPLADAIVARSGPGCFSLVGKTSLPRLAALFENAALLISVDTGPRHLAEAVGTPIVLLRSGQNHLGQWWPSAENVEILRREPACSPCFKPVCPFPGHDCMAAISVEDVVNAAGRLLAKRLEGVGA